MPRQSQVTAGKLASLQPHHPGLCPSLGHCCVIRPSTPHCGGDRGSPVSLRGPFAPPPPALRPSRARLPLPPSAPAASCCISRRPPLPPWQVPLQGRVPLHGPVPLCGTGSVALLQGGLVPLRGGSGPAPWPWGRAQAPALGPCMVVVVWDRAVRQSSLVDYRHKNVNGPASSGVDRTPHFHDYGLPERHRGGAKRHAGAVSVSPRPASKAAAVPAPHSPTSHMHAGAGAPRDP